MIKAEKKVGDYIKVQEYDFITSGSLSWLMGAAVIGYLLGSLPFGLIFTRLAGLGDVRRIGSGNIGATNVLRTGNRKVAAATLLADMLKATLAVVIFTYLEPNAVSVRLVAAFCALSGHLFPLWLGFKGGKGVATYLGILLALVPWTALAFVIVWLTCALSTRISSLSALLAVTVAGTIALILMPLEIGSALALMSAIIIMKHYENIKRLAAGTESKISFSSQSE